MYLKTLSFCYSLLLFILLSLTLSCSFQFFTDAVVDRQHLSLKFINSGVPQNSVLYPQLIFYFPSMIYRLLCVLYTIHS